MIVLVTVKFSFQVLTENKQQIVLKSLKLNEFRGLLKNDALNFSNQAITTN